MEEIPREEILAICDFFYRIFTDENKSAKSEEVPQTSEEVMDPIYMNETVRMQSNKPRSKKIKADSTKKAVDTPMLSCPRCSTKYKSKYHYNQHVLRYCKRPHGEDSDEILGFRRTKKFKISNDKIN